jgi:multidrug efflux system membrane fusion protein
MRIMPLLTALLVAGALYLIVLDRDTLLAFAQVERDSAATQAAPDAQEPRAVRVVALSSTAQTIDNGVLLRGRTEAARTVEVRAETSGLVISEPKRKGALVEAGDVLCELDAGTRLAQLEEARGRLLEARSRLPEAEARVPAARASRAEAEARVAESQSRLSEARARLNEAEINANAATRLGEGGFASETRVANAEAALESARAAVSSAEATLKAVEAQISSAEAGIEGAVAAVQSARAGIRSAEANVASAEEAISQLTITAPFGGLLETDTAELGSLLQPGGLCATVIQLDPIRLVGFVPEGEVDKLRLAAPAGARLPSGRDLTGEVTFLSRSADETTRTFRVEVTADNSELSIRDGQTADILIRAEGESAHLLPQSALTLDDSGQIGVRTVAEGSVALFLPVTILRDTVDGIWASGLPDTVDVIVTGQEYVTDGVPVEATYRDRASDSDTEAATMPVIAPAPHEEVDG